MRTPVVDFHNHVGRYGRLYMDDDPDRFVGFMDQAGVDRACMFNVWYGDAKLMAHLPHHLERETFQKGVSDVPLLKLKAVFHRK